MTQSALAVSNQDQETTTTSTSAQGGLVGLGVTVEQVAPYGAVALMALGMILQALGGARNQATTARIAEKAICAAERMAIALGDSQDKKA